MKTTMMMVEMTMMRERMTTMMATMAMGIVGMWAKAVPH